MAPTGGNIGIGFAIPANLAKKVILQLRDKGKVVRGYLGIVPAAIDDDTKEALKLKDKKGALISSVAADTPAAKAGLKQYDVVVEVNGRRSRTTTTCGSRSATSCRGPRSRSRSSGTARSRP
jgi:serine protease Do